jgi:hypothetical protein
MMKRFLFTHGRDGTQLRLEELPLWVYVMETAGEWVAEHLFPGHYLCCEVPDWAWDMGWGKYDAEWGTWEHSLGLWSMRFSSWVEMGFGSWRKVKYKGSVPVSYEWVQKHFPDLGSPFTDGWDNDAMESSANDSGDVIL